jgi:hypothetical protein
MPKVSELPGKLGIHQFHKEHDPPHFHVRKAGQSTRIRIAELTILQGATLSASDFNDVIAWARAHQAELALNWVLARAGMDLRDIPYP